MGRLRSIESSRPRWTSTHSSLSTQARLTLYRGLYTLCSTEREKIERQPPADSRSGEPRSRRVLLVTMINPLYETPKCSHEERRHDAEMSSVSMDVTPPAVSPAGPARKTLFRSSSKSGAGVHARTVPPLCRMFTSLSSPLCAQMRCLLTMARSV